VYQEEDAKMRESIAGFCMCTLVILAVVIVPTGRMRNNGEYGETMQFGNITKMLFSPGEFIVKLKKDTTFSKTSLMALNEKHQVYALEKIFPHSLDTNLDAIYRLHVPIDSDILALVQEYAICPDVVYAEPNGIIAPCFFPNDAYFNLQWSLHNTGQILLGNISGTSDADIDAPETWENETGNPEVIIAIVDSGIDFTHPDLAAHVWNNTDDIPNNGIDEDSNGYIDDTRGWDFYYHDNDPKDGHGHGTLCAGAAVAVTDNGVGIAGAGWNCTIMPVQIASECWTSDWEIFAAGIVYATDNGAAVISMSCGTYYRSDIIQDAVNYAFDKGVFLCAAAGNDNLRNKFYPAGFENVTAVAATNQNDQRCTKEDWDPNNYWHGQVQGSNSGDWVDIAAPGSLIFSTMPTYHVTYNDIINPYTGQNNSQEYDWFGCTSSASPLVAGVAALLLSKDSSLSPERVTALLCGNVDPYNSTVYIGTGRLNAQKALDALCFSPTPPTITGPISGKVGRLYNYTFTSLDPAGESISYMIDWGDGSFSDWIGPYPSGESAIVSYTWEKRGFYVVKGKAKDIEGYESDWGILEVKMRYLYIIPLVPSEGGYLERSYILFPLLQHHVNY
jgi:thermitase